MTDNFSPKSKKTFSIILIYKVSSSSAGHYQTSELQRKSSKFSRKVATSLSLENLNFLEKTTVITH